MAFVPYLRGLFDESLHSRLEYLATVQSSVDSQLTESTDDADVFSYLSTQLGNDANVADVYWSQGATPAIFLWTPRTFGLPYHTLICASADALGNVMGEVEHLLWHEGFRRTIDHEIGAVEPEVQRALNLSDNSPRSQQND